MTDRERDRCAVCQAVTDAGKPTTCPECPERILRILERGTRVRVPAGTPIVYDTAPEAREAVRRSQTVTVHWMTHEPDVIYWAGAGGYWKGVRLTNDMEVLFS